jgi:hypothetical protein
MPEYWTPEMTVVVAMIYIAIVKFEPQLVLPQVVSAPTCFGDE